MTPSKKKRKTREENIDIIKKVTLELLERKGYGDTSVNSIAEISGINISQVYRYFPNGKPDILIALAKDLIPSVNNEASATSILTIVNGREYLKQLVLQMISVHEQKKTILKSLQISFLSHPDLFKEDVNALVGYDSELDFFYELFLKLGMKNKKKCKEISRLFFHVMDTLIHRHALEVRITETNETLADFIADTAIRYVTGEK